MVKPQSFEDRLARVSLSQFASFNNLFGVQVNKGEPVQNAFGVNVGNGCYLPIAQGVVGL